MNQTAQMTIKIPRAVSKRWKYPRRITQRSPPKAAVPSLAAALKHEFWLVRDSARQNRRREGFRSAIGSGHRRERYAAVQTLRKIDDDKTFNMLVAALKDERWILRRVAQTSLLDVCECWCVQEWRRVAGGSTHGIRLADRRHAKPRHVRATRHRFFQPIYEYKCCGFRSHPWRVSTHLPDNRISNSTRASLPASPPGSASPDSGACSSAFPDASSRSRSSYHLIEPSLPNPKVRVVMNRGRQFHPIQHPLAPGELEVLPQVLEDELGGAFF